MVDAVEKIKDKKSYISLISQALISYHSELINDQKKSDEVSLGELQKLFLTPYEPDQLSQTHCNFPFD